MATLGPRGAFGRGLPHSATCTSQPWCPNRPLSQPRPHPASCCSSTAHMVSTTHLPAPRQQWEQCMLAAVVSPPLLPCCGARRASTRAQRCSSPQHGRCGPAGGKLHSHWAFWQTTGSGGAGLCLTGHKAAPCLVTAPLRCPWRAGQKRWGYQ